MDDIANAAHAGWLQPEIIEAILSDPDRTGLRFSEDPPISPCDGQLYLFDQTLVKNYKQDGVNWVKKKGSGRVQEVHQKITINGQEKITGFYSTSADDLSFRRRTYRLSVPGSSIFLVHYRKCERYKHAMKTESRYSLSNKANSDQMLSDSDAPQSLEFVPTEESFPFLSSHACVDLCTHALAADVCLCCAPSSNRNRSQNQNQNMSYLSDEAQLDRLAAGNNNANYGSNESMFCEDPYLILSNKSSSRGDLRDLQLQNGFSFLPESFEKNFDEDSFEFFSWDSESDEDLMGGKKYHSA
jgi:CG-1 domain